MKHYHSLILVTRLLFNIAIYFWAMRRLPEFSVYRSLRFPGTESPPQLSITPRRLDLPPSFASDWKKIGSKRKTMLMLDMPLWEKQKRKNCTNPPSIEIY